MTTSIKAVLADCDHSIPEALLPALDLILAQEFVDLEGPARAQRIREAIEAYNKDHADAPIVFEAKLMPVAQQLDDILVNQAGMKPSSAQPTDAASATTVSSTTVTTVTSVSTARVDDEFELPGQGETLDSISGLGGATAAQYDPDALVLTGQASMALLLADAGLLDLVAQPSFWQKLNLPVKSPLRGRIDEVLTALEDADNLIYKAEKELRQWLSEMYPPEFMRFVEIIARMNSIRLATALGGKQATADVTGMADDIGQLMSILPLIGERVTVHMEQSPAPNRVMRLVNAIVKVTSLLKDREIHAWVGQKVAAAKSDQEGAILLIQYLAPNATSGLKSVNQVRVSLGYEAVWAGIAACLANMTLKNLSITGARGQNMLAAFKMLQEGDTQSAPFRTQEDARPAVRPEKLQRMDVAEPARTAGGWRFSIDFRFNRS